jgi:hypothetical protein
VADWFDEHDSVVDGFEHRVHRRWAQVVADDGNRPYRAFRRGDVVSGDLVIHGCVSRAPAAGQPECPNVEPAAQASRPRCFLSAHQWFKHAVRVVFVGWM